MARGLLLCRDMTTAQGAAGAEDVRSGPSSSQVWTSPNATASYSQIEPGQVPTLLRLRVPTHIGRYRVRCAIGHGGMGVVYDAFDERLDRRIALKLVRGEHSEERRLRMIREAQALAQLSHPNVVHIYEIGEHDGQTFLAMEFIDGQTLRGWLKERPRSWRELLAVLCEIGNGLAAAHAAGLVHRDIKPENVLISREGRPCVVDFGLVCGDRLVSQASQASTLAERATAGDPLLEDELRLTRHGTLVGTPGYMSPEQLHGEAVDPRSDQFSFCVMAFEALYGMRPFPGESILELRAAVRTRSPRLPAQTPAPRRILRALLRGLSREPAARWPSMAALLAHLTVRARPGLRWPPVLAVATVVTLGAVWSGLSPPAAGSSVCVGLAEDVRAMWTAPTRATIRGALRDASGALAEDTWARIELPLQRRVDQLAAATLSACAAQPREDPEARPSRQMSCLQRQRLELAATLSVLERADAGVVHRAVEAVRGLPTVNLCSGDFALARLDSRPGDPVAARAADRLYERLTAVFAQVRAGRYRPARAELDAMLDEARELGDPVLSVRLLFERGTLRMELDEHALAAEDLANAQTLALAANADAIAAEALVKWIHEAGVFLGRATEALAMRPLALGLAQRSGDGRLSALLYNNLGAVHQSQGRFAEALAELERAAEEWARLGEHPIEQGATLMNLGIVLGELGRPAEGRASLERALELVSHNLGPNHPRVAYILLNLGLSQHRAGEPSAARDNLNRALAIARTGLGANHAVVARAHTGLGKLAREEGDHTGARQHLQRAIGIWQTSEPSPIEGAAAFIELARVAIDQKRWAAAEAPLLHALALHEATYGAEDARLLAVLVRLGELALHRGELERAQGLLLRAEACAGRGQAPAEGLAELHSLLAQVARARGEAAPEAALAAE